MQSVADSETASSVADVELLPSLSLTPTTTDTRGKHQILAELKRLEQESRFLEEELEELEKTENVSTTCQETNGPANPFWDRWFEGPQDSEGCRCWIL